MNLNELRALLDQDDIHNRTPTTEAAFDQREAEAALLRKDKPKVRRSFSQEELVAEARAWIKTHYPDSDPDKRFERLGLLIDFVTDLVAMAPEDRIMTGQNHAGPVPHDSAPHDSVDSDHAAPC